MIFCGIRSGQRIGGNLPQKIFAGSRIDRALQIRQSRGDARDIGFHKRNRLAEGETGDGIGSVTSQPGQLARDGGTARKFAPVIARDDFRGGVKIARAGIVAQSLPGVQHVGFRCRGEACEIGKSLEPFLIIAQDRGDLRLLEHELGNKDGVGIAGAAPR